MILYLVPVFLPHCLCIFSCYGLSFPILLLSVYPGVQSEPLRSQIQWRLIFVSNCVNVCYKNQKVLQKDLFILNEFYLFHAQKR